MIDFIECQDCGVEVPWDPEVEPPPQSCRRCCELFVAKCMISKLEKYVESEIAAIEADTRYKSTPADVQVNAPLALIQTELEGKMAVLRRVRKVLGHE